MHIISPASSATPRPPLILMGVSGSGKSTTALALQAQWAAMHASPPALSYLEGDDFHSPANIAKMAAGLALQDTDRLAWLDAIGTAIAQRCQTQTDFLVVTCSALKLAYRNHLRTYAPDAYFVHLSPTPWVLQHRLKQRAEHFMPASLLHSQLSDLEPLAPHEAGITINATEPLIEVLTRILQAWPNKLQT